MMGQMDVWEDGGMGVSETRWHIEGSRAEFVSVSPERRIGTVADGLRGHGYGVSLSQCLSTG